ncbi:Purple acid phosphatase [Zostera marina]|uniref:Purple acid phosphatase n=1 Tax=Zostera marina TaxID=29655 RepID=A0A0K9PXA7_ZOSMR|nr:Purple acid phosphatase [Zostera marina]
MSVAINVGVLLLLLVVACNAETSRYRRKLEASEDMPFDSDVFRAPPGYNSPQQVHITQGDHDGKGLIVSWVTPSDAGSSAVRFGVEEKKLDQVAIGKVLRYKYCNYTSGFIHHCTLKELKHNTMYFYEIGDGNSTRKFHFITPPNVGPDVRYTFGIIGDLGQTFDSNRTLQHYQSNPVGQTVLYVGDLSYADHYHLHDNRRWDSWGRFVERVAAYQPWIWTAGNHELDFLPEHAEPFPFKPFMSRYPTPYKVSMSTSPLWYSIKRGPAYIIVLSSYSAYGTYTPQYEWLLQELPKVNRSETPWLIVLVHSPWYNSYEYHFMEGETMRVMFEAWLVAYKVDIVFSGHVHAYERSVIHFLLLLIPAFI